MVLTSFLLLSCGDQAPDDYLHVKVDEVNADDFDLSLQSWAYYWEGGGGTYRVGYVGSPLKAGARRISRFSTQSGLDSEKISWYQENSSLMCCDAPWSKDAFFKLRFGEAAYTELSEAILHTLSTHEYLSKYSRYLRGVDLANEKITITYRATTPESMRAELNSLILSTGSHESLVKLAINDKWETMGELYEWTEHLTSKLVLSYDG